jgi:hypothetical protein
MYVYHVPNIYLPMKVSSKLAVMKGLDARLREIWCHLDLVRYGAISIL